LTALETAISSPVQVTLRGEEYEFAQLGLADWSAFCEFIKDERRTEINRADLPPMEKRHLYSEWIKSPVDLDSMLEQAMTFAGMEWLLWRAISKKHSSLTRGKVMDLFTDIQQATDVFGRIAGMPEDEEGDDQGNLTSG